jgi:hypothetical protein
MKHSQVLRLAENLILRSYNERFPYHSGCYYSSGKYIHLCPAITRIGQENRAELVAADIQNVIAQDLISNLKQVGINQLARNQLSLDTFLQKVVGVALTKENFEARQTYRIGYLHSLIERYERVEL